MEDLIFLIVEELYGEDPAKVVRTLSIKNKSSFKSLLQFTELDELSLRNALIVLIQQLIVSYSESPKLVYFLNEKEVLARIRFPLYVRLLNLKYGEDCFAEDILENGCCSISQILETANESHKNLDSVRNIFQDMIKNDYLLSVDKKTEYKEYIDTTPHKKVGKPRKKQKLSIPTETLVSAVPKQTNFSDSDTFYRVNFTKLNNELMGEMIGKLILSKTNLNCAVIAETMYKIGYKSLTKAEISKELPLVPKIPAQLIDLALETLEKSDLVIRDTENTWKINQPLIGNILGTLTLERIVQGKFGDYASRVFRILTNKGLLDDKTISDLTLLPLQETNICINELFVAGFVYSKSVGTSQMFYGVKIEEVKDDILKQSYRSLHNLKIKLASEMDEVWGLFQRVGFLSSEERQLLERYKHIESRIESAFLEIDRTIMIFTGLMHNN